MIPVYFDVPDSPEQKREHDAWFQRCIAEHLPEIIVHEEKVLSESLWQVTVDFSHVFRQLCDAYYGNKTHIRFHSNEKYYAFVGQLMAKFSLKTPDGHGSFYVGYDDAPIFRMTMSVFSAGDVSRFAGQMEDLLPDYRRLVSELLPSLSADVVNIDTGEEIRA